MAIYFGMSILLLASCAKPPEPAKPLDLEKLKVTIQKMEDAFAAGEKAKDAAAVAAYYAPDAVSYSRNTLPVSGAEAIKNQIAEGMAKDTLNNSNVYKVVDLFGEGNMLVEIGSWTKINPEGQVIKSGHYMSYFELRDGNYICVRDMTVN